MFLALLLLASWAASFCAPLAADDESRRGPAADSSRPKRVIGAIAQVREMQTEFDFAARVDTGATTSSVHVQEFSVEGGGPSMADNLGKKIHFRLLDSKGRSRWLQRRIAEVATIKTSERAETRYKVPLTLSCNGVRKRVLVSLNDRSAMTFPMLLGRNYLEGDFLVDVARRQ